MISIDGLAVEFGGTTLFSDVSFVINEKDRIALMGKNGAGKSTLLKILAGVRQPTRGKISAPKDSVIAYLPQHLMTEDGRTVFQETVVRKAVFSFSHTSHHLACQMRQSKSADLNGNDGRANRRTGQNRHQNANQRTQNRKHRRADRDAAKAFEHPHSGQCGKNHQCGDQQ